MPEKVRQNLIDKDMPEFNISIFAKYKPHKRWFTMRYTIVIAFAYGQYNVLWFIDIWQRGFVVTCEVVTS